MHDATNARDAAQQKGKKSGRVSAILEYLTENGQDLQTATAYAEPGYADPEDGACIVLANWNDRNGENTMKRAGDLLERLGCELEWEDEWATCSECSRAVRTQPDSYSWVPSYKFGEGEILCRACLVDDPEDYVSVFLLNRTDAADTFDVDLAALGFQRLEDGEGETGFHPGQNDRPEDMAERVPQGFAFVFQIDSVGQFDCRWSCWIRPEGNR